MNEIDMQMLALRREMGRLKRLRRLRNLAYALKHFEQVADKEAIDAFQRLRACEQWEPGLEQPPEQG